LAFLRIGAAVLVQANGCARSFQPSMNALILVLRSRTDRKVPRWMASALDQGDPDLDQVHPRRVGRCEVHDDRGLSPSRFFTFGVLVGGVVVHHQVRLAFGTPTRDSGSRKSQVRGHIRR
jgi:hypothetical protein